MKKYIIATLLVGASFIIAEAQVSVGYSQQCVPCSSPTDIYNCSDGSKCPSNTNSNTATNPYLQTPNNNVGSQVDDATPMQTQNTSYYCPNLTSTIYRGLKDANTGGQVTELQKFLADYYNVELSGGFFGKATQSYVIKFQGDNNLPSVGTVGKLTRAKIDAICSGTGSVPTGVSSTNYPAPANNVNSNYPVPTSSSVVAIVVSGPSMSGPTYDSSNKEVSITANATALVTAGNSDITIVKPNASAWPSNPLYFSLAAIDTAGHSGLSSNNATVSIDTANSQFSDSGNYWTIPAGRSARFNLTQSFNVKQMFAGQYHAVPALYDSKGTNILLSKDGNSVTIIGETSPYISSAIVDDYGMIRLTGARFDLSGNNVVIDGNVSVGGTKGDATTIIFGASTYNLLNGTHTIQIFNSQTGDSNKVYVNIGNTSKPIVANTSGTPTLLLNYDYSTLRESQLTASFTVNVTAGNSPVQIYKLNQGDSFYVNLTNSITGNDSNVSVGSNGIGSPSISPVSGMVWSGAVTDNGDYWQVTSGKTGSFIVTKTYNPQRLLAGQYYATVTFSQNNSMVPISNNTTNAITVIGEDVNKVVQPSSPIMVTTLYPTAGMTFTQGQPMTISWEATNPNTSYSLSYNALDKGGVRVIGTYQASQANCNAASKCSISWTPTFASSNVTFSIKDNTSGLIGSWGAVVISPVQTTAPTFTTTPNFSPSTINSTQSTTFSYTASSDAKYCDVSHPSLSELTIWNQKYPSANNGLLLSNFQTSYSGTFQGADFPNGLTTTINCYNASGQSVTSTTKLNVTSAPVATTPPPAVETCSNTAPEKYYLDKNPDVAAVVKSGAFRSGLQHWNEYGMTEGRASCWTARLCDDKDSYYLGENQDVLHAVETGAFVNGLAHWTAHGFAEGRHSCWTTQFGMAPNTNSTLLSSANSNSPKVLGVSCIDLPYNMHRGSEIASVSVLQKFLQDKGLLNESPTGFYGDKTIDAVKTYQNSHSLPETGMVYEVTRQAIRDETCR